MTNDQILKLKRSSHKLLLALHDFMNNINPKAGRGLIGELLVYNKLLSQYENRLLKNENNSIVFLGSSIKEHDIRLKLNDRIFNINAKGSTVRDKNHHPKWVRQHTLHKFVEIDKSSQIKVIRKSDKNLYYVFVDVQKWLDSRRADFYTLSDMEAKRIFGNKYKHLYNGKPRKTNSDDMWVEFNDVREFRDNSLAKFSKTLRTSNLNITRK